MNKRLKRMKKLSMLFMVLVMVLTACLEMLPPLPKTVYAAEPESGTVADMVRSGKIQVGDYIDYEDYLEERYMTLEYEDTGVSETQIVSTAMEPRWRVIKADTSTGECLIIPESVVNQFTLGGAMGYLKGPDTIRDVATTLYTTTHGTARAVTIADALEWLQLSVPANGTQSNGTYYAGYNTTVYSRWGDYWISGTVSGGTANGSITDGYNYLQASESNMVGAKQTAYTIDTTTSSQTLVRSILTYIAFATPDQMLNLFAANADLSMYYGSYGVGSVSSMAIRGDFWTMHSSNSNTAKSTLNGIRPVVTLNGSETIYVNGTEAISGNTYNTFTYSAEKARLPKVAELVKTGALKVGDFVDYETLLTEQTITDTSLDAAGTSQSVTTDTSAKWRVFYVDSTTGECWITTQGPVHSLTLSGRQGYTTNFGSEINLYKNKLAINIHNMTIADLNTTLGITDPAAVNTTTSYPYTYGQTRTYTTGEYFIPDSTSSGGETYLYDTGNGYYFQYRKASSSNPVVGLHTQYSYTPRSYNSTIGEILGDDWGFLDGSTILHTTASVGVDEEVYCRRMVSAYALADSAMTNSAYLTTPSGTAGIRPVAILSASGTLYANGTTTYNGNTYSRFSIYDFDEAIGVIENNNNFTLTNGNIKLYTTNVKTETILNNTGTTQLKSGEVSLVTGNGTILGEKAVHVKGGELIKTGGTITSVADGIYQSGGHVVVGTAGEEVSTTKPSVKGNNTGLTSTTGNWSFYDGVFSGVTTSINPNPNVTEAGYEVYRYSSQGYEYEDAYLIPGIYMISGDNTHFYVTLKDAIDAVPANGTATIFISGDREGGIIDPSNAVIPSGKTILLDLTDHTVTKTTYPITNNGKLTIVEGTILTGPSDGLSTLISNTGTLSGEALYLGHEGSTTGDWSVISATSGTVALEVAATIDATLTSGTSSYTGTAINLSGSANAVILEGIVQSGSGSGIKNTGSGIITLGRKDNAIALSGIKIIGSTYAIQSSNGFRFYDGMLEGSANPPYSGTVSDQETYTTVKVDANVPRTGRYMAYLIATENYLFVEAGTKFATLQQAIAAISGTGTIRVLNGNIDSSTSVIPNTKTITLDLYGNRIIKANSGIINNGTLTIKNTKTDLPEGAEDPGIISHDVAGYTVSNLMENTGTLTLEGIVLSHYGTESSIYTALKTTDGTVTINDSSLYVLEGSYVAAAGQGIALYNVGNTDINLTDSYIYGAIKTRNDIAIKYASNSNAKTLNIQNSTIVGTMGIVMDADTGVSQNKGKLIVSGDIYSRKQAIYLGNTNGSVNVTAGYIYSVNNSTIYGSTNSSNALITLGTHNGDMIVDSPFIRSEGSYGIELAGNWEFYDGIVGGEDTMINPLNKMPNMVEDGYGVIVDENWAWLEPGAYQVQSTGKVYVTLKEAIEASGTTDKITVIRDVEDSLEATVPSGKVITLDTAGKTISVTALPLTGEDGRNSFITNNGTLIMQDSVGNGAIQIVDTIMNGNGTKVLIHNDNNLTINSGNYIVDVSVAYDHSYPCTIWTTGGTTTINGGNISTINHPTMVFTTYWSAGIFAQSGDVIINNGNISASAYKDCWALGIVNNGLGNANIKVFGGEITANSDLGDAYGVVMQNHFEDYHGSTIEISGNPLITAISNGSFAVGVDNYEISSSDMIIRSGTIIASGDINYTCGVRNTLSKTIIGTLGGGTPSTSIPSITGTGLGISDAIGHGYEFYDGIIKGETAAIANNPVATEPGYEVLHGTSGVYKTATLTPGAYTVSSLPEAVFVTLEDAINAVQNGESAVITVNRNVTDPSNAVVPSNKNITINLNGNTITKTTSSITNEGTLTIVGTGTIQASSLGGTALIDSNASAKLVIGSQGDPVSTEKPVIQGNDLAIRADGTFEFYDGLIKSNNITITSSPTAVEPYYDVFQGVSGGMNVAYLKKKLTSVEVTTPSVRATYSEQEPPLIVKWKDTVLTQGTDYVAEYTNNKYVGTANVKVTGIGNYLGELATTFEIVDDFILDLEVTLNPSSYTYDGTEKEPTVTVKDGATTLQEGEDKDYVVTYQDNVNAGEAKAVITFMNFFGTRTEGFTINKASGSITPSATAVSIPEGETVSITYTYIGDGTISVANTNPECAIINLDTSTNTITLNAGTAGDATITILGTGGMNYTDASATITVAARTRRAATPVVTSYNAEYDGAAHTVAAAFAEGHTGEGTIVYSENGTSGWTTTPTSRTEPGTTTVYVKVQGDDSHDDSFVETGTITVSKRNLVITAKDQSISFGNSIVKDNSQIIIGGSGLASGQSLSGNVTLTPSTDQVTTNGTITPSGAVIKKGSIDVTDCYDIQYVAGHLTIVDDEGPDVLTTSTVYNASDNADITIYAKDAGTGIDRITVNGTAITIEKNDEERSATGPYEIKAKGTYTIVAYDNAGNSTTTTLNAYQISYNVNSSSETSGSTRRQIKIKDVDISLKANGFSKVGHTFTGWNTKGNGNGGTTSGGTAYAAGATYKGNGDVTMYAQWKVNKYKVTFYNENNISGEYVYASGEYEYGKLINVPADPIRYGKEIKVGNDITGYIIYTFDGWIGEKVNASAVHDVVNINSTNRDSITMIDSDVVYRASYLSESYDTIDATLYIDGKATVEGKSIGLKNDEGMAIVGSQPSTTNSAYPTIKGATSIENNKGVVLWYSGDVVGPMAPEAEVRTRRTR